MKKSIVLLLMGLLTIQGAAGQDIRFINKEATADQTLHKSTACWRLKTNLLYDALAVPNISLETHLGKNWSLGFGYWHTWLSSNTSHNYWRTYGGEINIRKYFGHQAKQRELTGHHLGAAYQMGTYDVELGKRGYMSDYSYTAGLEYGYTFPVSRRLSVDISMQMGYFGGRYKVYDPIDTHYVWQETRSRKWTGPVKAEITLACQIGKIETR